MEQIFFLGENGVELSNVVYFKKKKTKVILFEFKKK